MNKIRFLTDSGCDLPAELIAKANIDVIPFSIECAGRIYREGRDLTAFDLYDILENESALPTHSQINAFEIVSHYGAAFDEGYTDMVVCFISSTGSSTHANAVMAQDMFYEDRPEAVGKFDIHVVDTKTYSMGYGWPVYQAALMHRRGAGLSAVLAYLEDWFSQIEIYCGLYSLKHARKSGRLGGAASIIGEALGIRPVLSLIGGEVKQIATVRGDKALIPALVKVTKEKRRSGTQYIVLGGNLPGCSKELEQAMKAACGEEYVGFYQLGPVVSINTGPRAIVTMVLGAPRKR
ncbi:MAG TPA: DegV family protein [Candidatus Acidoferrum sp.]|nr:DegV family protein [Candidatus Acidoferrum sp.]